MGCSKNMSEIHFADLLDICADPGHECYQQVWREFERRYQNRILVSILRTTKDADLVNEAFSLTHERLLDKEFHALKTFRERHSETAFETYLGTIARYAALATVQKNPGEEELDPHKHGKTEELVEAPEEIHQRTVKLLRAAHRFSQKQDFKQELHTFIYRLTQLDDFTARDVVKITLLDETEGNITNISYNIKKLIEKNENKLSDELRESGAKFDLNIKQSR